MNNDIMAFPNTALYEGKLSAHSSCADISLSDLSNVSRAAEVGDEETETELLAPVVFYDTAGCEFYEASPSPEEGILLADSKSNIHEVEIVTRHLQDLFDRGLQASQVTILTPYSAQVALLHSTIRSHRFTAPQDATRSTQTKSNWEPSTACKVERKMSSSSRSYAANEEKQVGFLAQKKRLNVAMTRAKRQLGWWGMQRQLQGRRICLMISCPRYMQWSEDNAVVHSVVATL